MKQFDSVDEVLDFAISREIEAHDFYKDLAGTVQNRFNEFQLFERQLERNPYHAQHYRTAYVPYAAQHGY